MTEEQFYSINSDDEPRKMKREAIERPHLLPRVSVFSAGLTKKEIRDLANETVLGFMEGRGNILKVAEALSAMEAYVKAIKDSPEYKELVIAEVGKFGKGTQTASGAKIELAEVGVKYDYSQCGDAEWELLDAEINRLSERKKERETFLKSLPAKGIEHVDQETGEATHIFPPSRESTSSFKVTLKR